MQQALRRALAAGGVSEHEARENFSFHSIRIGAAVRLILLGFTMEQVMRLGGWTSESAVVIYLRSVADAHDRDLRAPRLSARGPLEVGKHRAASACIFPTRKCV